MKWIVVTVDGRTGVRGTGVVVSARYGATDWRVDFAADPEMVAFVRDALMRPESTAMVVDTWRVRCHECHHLWRWHGRRSLDSDCSRCRCANLGLLAAH